MNGTNYDNSSNVNNNITNHNTKYDINTFLISNQCDFNSSNNNNCSITDKVLINTNKGKIRVETISKVIQAPNKMVWKNEISTICGGKHYSAFLNRNYNKWFSLFNLFLFSKSYFLG